MRKELTRSVPRPPHLADGAADGARCCMPVLILGMGKLAQKRASTQLEKPLEMPVVGVEHAPNLVALPGQARASTRKAGAGGRRRGASAARTRTWSCAIGADFAEDWRARQCRRRSRSCTTAPAGCRDPGAAPANAAGAATASRSARCACWRAGSARRSASPRAHRPRDLATPEAKRGHGAVASCRYSADPDRASSAAPTWSIDTTAGERERQSLEPLLATPAARGAIVSGKIAAACADRHRLAAADPAGVQAQLRSSRRAWASMLDVSFAGDRARCC